MFEQLTERPAIITALNSLIDQLLANPVTAVLMPEGNWSIRNNGLGASITVLQHVHVDEPQRVLDVVASTFGGTFTVQGPANHGYVWHELETTWQGVRLEFKLAAPGLSAEDTLRARVAELESQLAAQQPSAFERGQAEVDAWNASCPIGTPVTAYPDTRDDEPVLSRTRTVAWMAGGHTPVVMVEDYSSWIALTHVDVRTEPAPVATTAVMPLAERTGGAA